MLLKLDNNTLIKIKWSSSDSEPTDDWCGKYKGKYVDLTLNYAGTWSYWYDNQIIQGGFPSREIALQKLTEFLVDNKPKV